MTFPRRDDAQLRESTERGLSFCASLNATNPGEREISGRFGRTPLPLPEAVNFAGGRRHARSAGSEKRGEQRGKVKPELSRASSCVSHAPLSLSGGDEWDQLALFDLIFFFFLEMRFFFRLFRLSRGCGSGSAPRSRAAPTAMQPSGCWLLTFLTSRGSLCSLLSALWTSD